MRKIKYLALLLLLLLTALVWSANTRDNQVAMLWWKLTSVLGNAKSQNNLAFLYFDGKDVAQNYAEAVRLWEQAAEQGNARAQVNLGAMYARGLGVTQDYTKAYMWYSLPPAQEKGDSITLRDLVTARMTPQQIEKAQEMAKACQARNFKGC